MPKTQIKTMLSERLLGKVIENSTDVDLEQAYKELEEYKNKYPRTFQSLNSHPFISDLISMIDEQYRYRNQAPCM